jgi:transketolase
MKIKNLSKRILEITKKHDLSHLSSCLTTLPILIEIFSKKEEEDHFVLSNGHAGLALYVILEDLYGFNAEELFLKNGIHPNRDLPFKLEVSTGSLGSGILVATGLALGDKNKNTYVIISDGECAEGSIWESLRFSHEQKLDNLKIYVNANGLSAYDEVDINYLKKRIMSFNPKVKFKKTNKIHKKYPFLKGTIDDHYEKLK